MRHTLRQNYDGHHITPLHAADRTTGGILQSRVLSTRQRFTVRLSIGGKEMIDYVQVAEELRRAGAEFRPIGADQAMDLRSRFAGLPQDYVEFLTSVGIGSSPDLKVMFPTDPASIIGDSPEARRVVPYAALVVAYSDGMFGYRPDWTFGMLSTEVWEFTPISQTFSEWIRDEVRYL